MRLDLFPPEILGCILGFSSTSYLVIRLWKCGDHVLNKKLAMGVTTTTLRQHPQVATQWPALLSQLDNLRRLSVSSDTDLVLDPNGWLPTLKALPKTLEALEINSPDEPLALNGHGDDEELARTAQEKGTTLLLNIGTIFPCLRELFVSNVDHYSLFPVLPPTLTTLGSTSTIKCGSSPLISLLPRSLERLEAYVLVHFGITEEETLFADWSLAPPNLQHIDILRWVECPSSAKWIPRSLTSGRIGFSGRQSSPLCARELSSLPPLLTEASFELCTSARCKESHHRPGDTWSSQLPKSLKALRAMPSAVLSPHSIQSLPSSLTKLDITEISGAAWNQLITHDSIINWPPCLEVLSLSIDNLNAGTLAILPRNIKELELKVRTSGLPKALFADALPSTLQALSVRFATRGSGEVPIIGNLPTSLTDITLHHDGYECFALTGLSLPDSLTSLIYTSSVVLKQLTEPWALPRGLTVLELAHWRFDWFGAIPPSVTHLNITHLCSDPLSPPSSEIDLFSDLTPSVVVLKIENNYPIPDRVLELSSTAFSTLVNLEVIFAPTALLLPSKAIRTLPRTLRELDIPVKRLEAEDITFIPPDLTICFTETGIDWQIPNLAEHWPVRALNSVRWDDDNSAFCDRLMERQSEICH